MPDIVSMAWRSPVQSPPPFITMEFFPIFLPKPEKSHQPRCMYFTSVSYGSVGRWAVCFRTLMRMLVERQRSVLYMPVSSVWCLSCLSDEWRYILGERLLNLGSQLWAARV